jgi:hypothetical protein
MPRFDAGQGSQEYNVKVKIKTSGEHRVQTYPAWGQ